MENCTRNYTINGIAVFNFKKQLLLILQNKGNCLSNCYECPLINSCYDVSYGSKKYKFKNVDDRRFELAKKRFLELFPNDIEELMEILL